MATAVRSYTIGEEIWHCTIHGMGIILSIAGLVILAALSAIKGNAWTVVSTVIFGVSMVMLYTASTLYHAVPNEHAKKVLKKFDHIAIYYLIAGTYTPFMLVPLRGALGWTIFGIIWGLAILGTILKLTLGGAGTKWWSVGLYLLMGWLIMFSARPLIHELSNTAFVFLLLGGLCYTLGIVFYIWKSKKYTHAIWHFMVLAGTIMHFFAVLFGCVLN
ncbi:MAG: hemolysin III family protein [Alphaproteobacteria bacterium]|nr:hemolysin III family protein [Alphaproteobacteria bacterium]